jgi:hypothetical protein
MYLDVQRATVCTRLGRRQEALALWEDIIPGPASVFTPRPRVFSARRAQALAGMGEPEQAATIDTASA